MQLKEKVAIVTGGASGIGRATAIRLASEGASLVVADIDVSGGQETCQQISAKGRKAIFVQADVSQEQQAETISRSAISAYGQIDILVNNAACFIFRSTEATAGEWEKILAVNVTGSALCAKYVVREMKRAGKGAIVNLASISSFIAQGDSLTYNTSKTAILGLTRCMAMDLAPFGIRVNAVAPGCIKTPALYSELTRRGRRSFLRTTGAIGFAAGFSAFAQNSKPALPNDRIGVAVIGCGGMGRMNLADFQKNPEVQIVALCDVYQPNLEKALALVQGKAKTYRNYRQLLEDREVQAVVISTPDHWHALMCVDACNAGKDVYVEKPVSYCIREGRLMVEAARRNNRVVQAGLQQRSGTHFQRAVRFIQEEQLGKVHYVQCWNHESSSPEGMGNPAYSDPPPELDWDLWLGPAPKVPFNKNRFGPTFRNFFDYAGGQLTDWGSHLIDIVHWAMQVRSPLSSTASGGKYHYTDNRDTPDTFGVVYESPAFLLHYSTLEHNTYGHNGNPGAKPFGSYGILFHGTLGTLFIDRAGDEIIPQAEMHREPVGAVVRDVDDLTGTSLYFTSRLAPGRGTTSVQHRPHVRNFLDCLKNRQRPNADIEIGHWATTACHLGNIAFRVGQKVLWDEGAERVTNLPKANELVTRQYRRPWDLAGLV